MKNIHKASTKSPVKEEDLNNENAIEDINKKEGEMATKKGCERRGKAPPKEKGRKCGKKLKKKKPKSKRVVKKGTLSKLFG